MVEDYLSDREQEEALRNWWRDNWRWVFSGVALGLVALVGWQYWQRQAQLRGEAAAQAYSDLTTALGSGEKDKVDQLIKELDTTHKSSPYADQAHLLSAQNKVALGQFEQAASELKTVVDSTKDAALAQVAKLRLARVQLQLGHPDEALALLDVSKAGAFGASVQELRGDVLLAKGDRAGARLAYQAAISESVGSESPVDSELLRLKLQDLGDLESAPSTSPTTAPSATPATAADSSPESAQPRAK